MQLESGCIEVWLFAERTDYVFDIIIGFGVVRILICFTHILCQFTSCSLTIRQSKKNIGMAWHIVSVSVYDLAPAREIFAVQFGLGGCDIFWIVSYESLEIFYDLFRCITSSR